MAGDANLIKQAMQLADDGGDLLGQVARVHVGSRASQRPFLRFKRACTNDLRAGGGTRQARNASVSWQTRSRRSLDAKRAESRKSSLATQEMGARKCM